MQCFHYLGKLGSSLGLTANPPPIASSSHIVPESPATSLARTLHAFSEHVAPVLNHRRLNVFIKKKQNSSYIGTYMYTILSYMFMLVL